MFGDLQCRSYLDNMKIENKDILKTKKIKKLENENKGPHFTKEEWNMHAGTTMPIETKTILLF